LLPKTPKPRWAPRINNSPLPQALVLLGQRRFWQSLLIHT